LTHREKPVTNFALSKCNSYRYVSGALEKATLEAEAVEETEAAAAHAKVIAAAAAKVVVVKKHHAAAEGGEGQDAAAAAGDDAADADDDGWETNVCRTTRWGGCTS
jgi:hypothetical protein